MLQKERRKEMWWTLSTFVSNVWGYAYAAAVVLWVSQLSGSVEWTVLVPLVTAILQITLSLVLAAKVARWFSPLGVVKMSYFVEALSSVGLFIFALTGTAGFWTVAICQWITSAAQAVASASHEHFSLTFGEERSEQEAAASNFRQTVVAAAARAAGMLLLTLTATPQLVRLALSSFSTTVFINFVVTAVVLLLLSRIPVKPRRCEKVRWSEAYRFIRTNRRLRAVLLLWFCNLVFSLSCWLLPAVVFRLAQGGERVKQFYFSQAVASGIALVTLLIIAWKKRLDQLSPRSVTFAGASFVLTGALEMIYPLAGSHILAMVIYGLSLSWADLGRAHVTNMINAVAPDMARDVIAIKSAATSIGYMIMPWIVVAAARLAPSLEISFAALAGVLLLGGLALVFRKEFQERGS